MITKSKTLRSFRKHFSSNQKRIRRRAEQLSNITLSFETLEPRQMLDAGALDLSFSMDGYAFLPREAFPEYGAGNAVALQSDGKIVVGGLARSSDFSRIDNIVARFNTDGSLDTTFGVTGIYVDNLDHIFTSGSKPMLFDLAVDDQDRIIWTGSAGMVSRLSSDGTLDTDFGFPLPATAGHWWSAESPYSDLRKVIATANGGALAIGNSYPNGFIMQLTEEGLPDSGFGNGTFHGGAFGPHGYTLVNFDTDSGNVEEVFDASLTPDGKIVVVGHKRDNSGAGVAFVAQLDADGSVDSGFGTGGRVVLDIPGTPFYERATSVAVDSFGRITVLVSRSDTPEAHLVVRLNGDGSNDSTFGGGDGIAELGIYSGFDNASKLTIQSDGKIVTTGAWAGNPVVARLNVDGSLDTSFGNYPGKAYLPQFSTAFGTTAGVESSNDVVVQSDGKIVIVGRNFNRFVGDLAPGFVIGVARLEGGLQPTNVSGQIFSDANNDGSFQSGSGESGIADITVTLTGTDISNNAVNRTIQSLADGSFNFENVMPGTYSLSSDQPVGFLDGKETAGNFGGTVDNASDSNSIANFVIGTDGTPATDYLFGEVRPAELSGLVWEDFNNDGQVNFGETAIENALISLTGIDDRGNGVNLDSYTDNDGVFMFSELRPGEYSLAEAQPAGFVDAADVLGIIDGLMAGTVSGNDQFANLVLKPDSIGINYNFAERPLNGGQVSSGQTATIGFWQNNNGRALILAMNGGANSTQLSSWLAATLPNMYGADAGGNDLTGMTNLQVWEFYNALFRRKQKEAQAMGLGGPVKTDAQVFATALAVYVTNGNLAGTTGTGYGFTVTEHGVGTSTFDVGNYGEAFGVANDTSVSVMDLLLAVNERSRNGVLYDMDDDGDANDSLEINLRTILNNVFSTINESGDR